MRIIVEDSEVELDLPKTDILLKQVIDEVEEFLFKVGKIPVSLTVDGYVLSQEELETKQEEEVKGTETIEFGVMSIFEFINSNLGGASKANKELLESILTFAKEIHSVENAADNQSLIVELNHFFDFWYRLSQLIPEEFEQLDFDGRKFDEVFKELSSLFEEIVGAMEDKDFVLAGDLLQYEVVPSIESIDAIIPVLSKMVAEADQRSKNEIKESAGSSQE